MDPITLSILASGAASIIGGIGANDTAKKNADISLLNYYEQQAANTRARQEGQRQQAEAKLGTTDAAGNRTMYVPGRGWVTILAEDQQELQNLTEAEQLRMLTDEAGRESERSTTAEGRRGREDISADEADRASRAVRRGDEASVRDMLISRGGEARNQQADRAGNAAARQNVRAGGANAAELLQGQRATSDAESSRAAVMNAMQAAPQMVDQKEGQQRDGANALYDYFRRSSTSGTSPVSGYMPTGPQARSTAVADQGVMNVMSRSPQLDYQSTNNAFASTLSDLSSLGGQWGMAKQNDKLFEAISDRYGKNTGAV